jgi:hypothetical protein
MAWHSRQELTWCPLCFAVETGSPARTKASALHDDAAGAGKAHPSSTRNERRPIRFARRARRDFRCANTDGSEANTWWIRSFTQSQSKSREPQRIT